MKKFLAGVAAAGALAACAEQFIGVESDPSAHTVKFSAVSTDCGLHFISRRDTRLSFSYNSCSSAFPGRPFTKTFSNTFKI